MKVTKRQLRRIIKEEKQKLLAENRVRRVVRRLLETSGDASVQGGSAAANKVMASLNMKTSGFSTGEEYDQGIALMARIYSDDEAAKKIYVQLFHLQPLTLTGAKPGTSKEFQAQYPGKSPETRQAREDIMADYESGDRDWEGMLKKLPVELKEDLFTFHPRSSNNRHHLRVGEYSREAEAARAAAKAGKRPDHPYDASVIDVEEVLGHLKSAGASDLVYDIETAILTGADDIWDVLTMIPKEIKDKLPKGNRKSKPKSGTKTASKAASHPYDVSINDAVDAGYFSNSDAVDEVQDHLRSAGAMDLVDEIEELVQYGDDDIYDILAMIPKAIKDKLPIG